MGTTTDKREINQTQKKYEFTGETKQIWGGTIVRQIKRKPINKNDDGIGGWIETEENLSHEGKCWIGKDTIVHGNAKVYENASVWGATEISGNAKVHGNASITGECHICDNAEVYENACIEGYVSILENAKVHGPDTSLYGHARILGNADISGHVTVGVEAEISGNAKLSGRVDVRGEALVTDNADIYFDKIRELDENLEIVGETYIGGDVVIRGWEDFMVFKESWDDGSWYTWTRADNMWRNYWYKLTEEQFIENMTKKGEMQRKIAEKFIETVHLFDELAPKKK